MKRAERDCGQAISLVLALVVVAVVLAAASARFGARLADQRQAQLAADAAALAGVVDGRDAAEQLAIINGGVLIEYAASGEEVLVKVRVGNESARARATRAP